MKDRRVVAAVVIVGAIGYTVAFFTSPASDRASDLPASTSTTTSSVVTTTEPTTTTTTTPTVTTDDVEPARARAFVTNIVDGDTLDVIVSDIGEEVRIRLIGIDTPEVYGGTECYGPEASTRATELALLEWVGIELDDSQGLHDRYGRLLAYVWLEDGRMLQDTLIAEGFGEEYLYREPYRYHDEFVAAETASRARGAGLWGAC